MREQMEIQPMEIEAMSDALVDRLADYYWERASELNDVGDEGWSAAFDKAKIFVNEQIRRESEYETSHLI